MRCFQPPADTRFYAGVDLHARSLYLAVLDRDGQACCSRNLPAAPEPVLRAVQPFRDGLVVGCECRHCWYWLADTCREQDIPFARGHAWALKAVPGSKTKCDRHDAQALARRRRGGNFPLAYAYPRERRGLRDLRRARRRLVRQRAELYGHVPTARRQANRPPVSSDVQYQSKRAALTADIADPFVRRRVETDLTLLEPRDVAIRRLEAESEDAARQHFPTELAVLQSTPGVGLVRSLTILVASDPIDRFDTRQPFCSYARLCGAVQASAGQRVGTGNRKAGNAWLKGACSEAAVLSAQKDEHLGRLLERLTARLGQTQALAPKLGRACYHLLHTKEVFAVQRCVRPCAPGRPASRRRTGAQGASPNDDTPMSRDHESAIGCPRPQPRYPDALMGRRPRPPLASAVVRPGRGPGVGRGTKRDQRAAVSLRTGLVPRHHPNVHPTPAGPWPARGTIA
jgi:transposase